MIDEKTTTATAVSERPRATVNQGVFLVSLQIAGDTKACRKFAKALAHRVEQLYGEFMHDERLGAFEMHYNFNLSRWEQV